MKAVPGPDVSRYPHWSIPARCGGARSAAVRSSPRPLEHLRQTQGVVCEVMSPQTLSHATRQVATSPVPLRGLPVRRHGALCVGAPTPQRRKGRLRHVRTPNTSAMRALTCSPRSTSSLGFEAASGPRDRRLKLLARKSCGSHHETPIQNLIRSSKDAATAPVRRRAISLRSLRIVPDSLPRTGR